MRASKMHLCSCSCLWCMFNIMWYFHLFVCLGTGIELFLSPHALVMHQLQKRYVVCQIHEHLFVSYWYWLFTYCVISCLYDIKAFSVQLRQIRRRVTCYYSLGNLGMLASHTSTSTSSAHCAKYTTPQPHKHCDCNHCDRK